MIWEISVLRYIQMGGWVMFPLIFLSFVLAYLIVERFMFFSALGTNDLSADELIEHLERKTLPGKNRKGIYTVFLERLVSCRTTYKRIDRLIIHEVHKNILPLFSKNMQSIGALTAAAPLLGLLGTVSGMVTTFNVMNISGTGNPKAMSAGISEALITTQYGLVVAIIGVYISMILARRVKRYETMIDEICIHLIRKFQL